MNGIERIATEYKRVQAIEGWTPEHDATHVNSEMALAASSYAIPAEKRAVKPYSLIPQLWPWEPEWWKPGDRVRELEKAGALIAFEIDRLLAQEGEK